MAGTSAKPGTIFSSASRTGRTKKARGNSLQIGREGGDLNFPMDLYMSGSHCRIEEHSGKFTLTDLNSRNDTYVRLKTGEKMPEYAQNL